VDARVKGDVHSRPEAVSAGLHRRIVPMVNADAKDVPEGVHEFGLLVEVAVDGFGDNLHSHLPTINEHRGP